VLPDLPTLKGDIQRVLLEYFHGQVYVRLGFLSDVPKHTIHEGRHLRTVRADGTIEESDLKQASAEMAVPFEEAPRMTLEQRIAKINDMADQMARQMGEQLFGSLNETLDKAGQTVDRKGQPLDAEAIFSVLEKIEIEFDETGKHKELSIVVPPALESKAKQAFEQLQTDPVLRKRYDEIMMRKRMAWLDREASRKLVG
jgi:hypothetical protein